MLSIASGERSLTSATDTTISTLEGDDYAKGAEAGAPECPVLELPVAEGVSGGSCLTFGSCAEC